MPLPEGREPLTDGDMVILLHSIARQLEGLGQRGADLRQTADRLAELSKAEKVAQHKAIQG